ELTLQLLILLFLLLRFAPIGMSTTTYLRFTQRNVCRFDFVTSAHEVLTLDLQRTFQLHDVDEAIEDSVTFAHLVFEALHQTTELAEHEGFAFLQRGEPNPTDDDFGALSRGHGHELVGGVLLEESDDVQVCFVHEAFVELLLSVTVSL